MKTLICAAFAASLVALGCSSTTAEPELGTSTGALRADTDIDPDPHDNFDAAPPPPPAPTGPVPTTCTNQTNDGVCRRYCCSETSWFKRCSVLPCP